MARMIDGDAVKRRIWGIVETWKFQGRKYDALLLESVIAQIVDPQPTLTPPNEWVNAKDNPPQLTGKYICCVEDTHGYMWSIPADYLLEMKTWVGEFGEIKNKVVYWMPLPAPPNCRPPEGEEDT